MIQTPSVSPTVIVGVVVVVVIAGVLAVIVLAGQTKGIHFVISGSLDIPVTRSPIESAVHNRRPIDYRASAGEVPEDISGGLFLFVADLVRLQTQKLTQAAGLPGSKMIPADHALRCCLALKLWSIEQIGRASCRARVERSSGARG